MNAPHLQTHCLPGNCRKTLILFLAILAVSVQACQDKDHFELPPLQIIPTAPAVLELLFPSVSDSLHIKLHVFNEITGRILKDTMIGEEGRLNWPVNLEIAKQVQLVLNGKTRWLFLIPGEVTTVRLGLDQEHQYDIGEFSGIAAPANRFYQERDRILETEDIRFLYSALAGFEDIQECFAAIDSIGRIRQQHLEQAYDLKKIPDWFYEFENTNIRYDNYTRKSGSISYREYMMRTRGERAALETIEIPLPLENPAAYANDAYWSFLQGWGMFTFCTEDCFGQERTPLPRISAIVAAMQSLQDRGLKEKALALQYSMIRRSSFSFPDSLLLKVKNGMEQSPGYLAYLDSLLTPGLEGGAVPFYYLKNAKGNFSSPEASSGKVTLLSFWFVGCTPCYREFPHEDRLAEQFEDQPFELISICVNSSEADWRSVLDKEQLQGTQLFANENWSKKLMRNYQIGGFPHLVLVDQAGMVVDQRAPRPSDPVLEENIRKLLESGQSKGITVPF